MSQKTADNAFKESFKYYKSKVPPPDLSGVLNLGGEHEINANLEKVRRLPVSSTSSLFGLVSCDKWKVYEIHDRPGLIYIRNPFTCIGERYWITRCLKDYTGKPNKLNLDAHGQLPPKVDWWDYCRENGHMLKKLRWATMGYHHDWDTKIYSEASKSDFPLDLHVLCSFIGEALGFENFNAQAAIVNFYNLDSTLSGHTDHSERNLDAPLFSFSFGNSSIFLLGGENLADKPTALFLHSGDVVVMSRESRLCYHGVPKIINNWDRSVASAENAEENPEFDRSTIRAIENGELWRPFEDYLETSRININVRQVN